MFLDVTQRSPRGRFDANDGPLDFKRSHRPPTDVFECACIKRLIQDNIHDRQLAATLIRNVANRLTHLGMLMAPA